MASSSSSEITILHSNTGRRFTVRCSLTEKVSRLKELISEASGIAPACQRLVSSGKDITNKDGETLRRVGCVGIGSANPFVHLIERVRTVVDLTSSASTDKESRRSVRPASSLGEPSNSSSTGVVSVTIDDDSDEDDCVIVGVTRGKREVVILDELPEECNPLSGVRRGPPSRPPARPSCAFATQTTVVSAESSGQPFLDELTGASSSTCRALEAPSSSSASKGESAPCGKKRRRSSAERAAPGEKRQARFRSSCPYAVQQRIERAVSQRLYLVSRTSPTRTNGEISESFTVLGSTGNIYDVTVGPVPYCSCPDHAEGNLCKHILFVLLKVLRVPAQSQMIYQKALLPSELNEILTSPAAKRPCAGMLANTHVRQTYHQIHGHSSNEDTLDGMWAEQQQRPIEDGTECPICFEEIACDGEKLVFCRAECGRSLHADCFERWAKQKRASLVPVTCIFCRSLWVEDASTPLPAKGKGKAKASAGSTRMSEGYVNLGQLQGQSQTRDTSTYRQFWYDDYDN